MAEGRTAKAREPGKAHRAFSPKRFESSPEFVNFKGIVRKLLAVPKPELDEMVREAKETSPRVGNPKAAGRKPKSAP